MVKFVLWGDIVAYQRKERSGFMVLHRSRVQLGYLSDEEKGKLLTALVDYSEFGEKPCFGGTLGMAFDTMAEQIDFYADSFNKRCEANRKNRKTIVDHRQPSSTIVDEDDQSKQNKTNLKQNILPISPKGDSDKDAFISFWSAYPKKRDKAKAQKAFTKAAGKVDLETMLQALEVQKQSPDWQKDGGQYIPLPTTWLNGCRWEDETAPIEAAYTYSRRPDVLPEYND